jgi:glycosyltransferase involved in cell wall biosynthesis
MLKKALLLNPYWDSLGGGERYTATFANLLINRGWSVDIYWPSNLSIQIRDRFGIDISRANWRNTTYSPKKSLGYQLVFWVSDGSLPTSFSKKTIIHLQFPFLPTRKSFMTLIKAKAYTFVVNSQFTKAFIDKGFIVDSHVVYPPIDTSLFLPNKKTNTILYVGRFSNLTQTKGQDVLIKSFKNIYSQLPDWRLVLAGGTTIGTDPKVFQDLKKLASGYPIEFVTNPDFNQLKSLFSQSQIFWSASGFGVNERLQPTKTEHFGISLVEAMASGCVPIVVRAGGHSEIVDHGVNGFLWDQTSQLESHTLKLVGHSQLARYSKAAIKKSKIFDVSEFNNRFNQIINL